MTDRAGLVRPRLVMEVRRPRGIAERRTRMALQTKNIEIARLEQMRIGGAMWGVARFAAFCLDWLMLEDERPLLIHVAGEANGIPRRG